VQQDKKNPLQNPATIVKAVTKTGSQIRADGENRPEKEKNK
jgi:hypothetical protein